MWPAYIFAFTNSVKNSFMHRPNYGSLYGEIVERLFLRVVQRV